MPQRKGEHEEEDDLAAEDENWLLLEYMQGMSDAMESETDSYDYMMRRLTARR